MSRGPGAVQRRILEQLKLNPHNPADDAGNRDLHFASWTTVLDLAGPGATRAQIESTRRAVRKLQAAGMIQVGYVFGRGRERPTRNPNSWSGTTSPWLLAARLCVENVPTSGRSQRLTPEHQHNNIDDKVPTRVGGSCEQAAEYVLTRRHPDTAVSVENAQRGSNSQHLGRVGGCHE